MFIGGASPRKERPHEKGDRLPAEVAIACKNANVSQIPVNVAVLHADTSPERIAEDQRKCVQQYLNLFGFTSLEAISEEVVLPVSVVRQRLVELKELRPCRKKKPKHDPKKPARGGKMFHPVQRPAAVV